MKNCNAPYSALGGIFEYLNDDCGYEEWSQYLIDKLRGLGVLDGAQGLDIGCGNGYFTRALYAAGYDMKGMDISPEMLTKAVELSRAKGLKIDYISGDIVKLKLNYKPDFIVAVNDCVNYIEKTALKRAFKAVYGNLKKGGAFIFDISSERKLKHIIGDNLFGEDRGDISYLWFNSLKDDRVEMDITVFTRRSDGLYERAEESQTQYIHGETEILSLLKEVGFEAVSEGDRGLSKENRINFICRKL
ncbi:MAG: class I SAM-dependent methyltransferase [Clostridia bacterium]|jgi:SAM-dependent methyltransferase|nr:class I SAM-dependent methyltransferase [Clostridia bacterium]